MYTNSGKGLHVLHALCMKLVSKKIRPFRTNTCNEGNHEGFPRTGIVVRDCKFRVEDEGDSDVGGTARTITITYVALVQNSTLAAYAFLITNSVAAHALWIHKSAIHPSKKIPLFFWVLHNNTTLPSPKPNATDLHEIALRGKILMFGVLYLIQGCITTSNPTLKIVIQQAFCHKVWSFEIFQLWMDTLSKDTKISEIDGRYKAA